MGYGFSCFEPLTLCEQWYRRGVLPDKGGLLTGVKVQSSRLGWHFTGNMLRALGTQPGGLQRIVPARSGCQNHFWMFVGIRKDHERSCPLALCHSVTVQLPSQSASSLGNIFFQILLGVVQVLDGGKTRGSVRPVPEPGRVFQRRSDGQG